MEIKPMVLSNRPLRSRKQVQSLMPSLESTFYEKKGKRSGRSEEKRGWIRIFMFAMELQFKVEYHLWHHHHDFIAQVSKLQNKHSTLMSSSHEQHEVGAWWTRQVEPSSERTKVHMGKLLPLYFCSEPLVCHWQPNACHIGSYFIHSMLSWCGPFIS